MTPVERLTTPAIRLCARRGGALRVGTGGLDGGHGNLPIGWLLHKGGSEKVLPARRSGFQRRRAGKRGESRLARDERLDRSPNPALNGSSGLVGGLCNSHDDEQERALRVLVLDEVMSAGRR